MDDSDFECKRWYKISRYQNFHTGFGAHRFFYLVGTGGSFPEVKRPVREVNHKPPSITEVKNRWSCTSALPIYLYGVEGNISPFLTLMLLYMRV